jgi:hypothetical protein
MSTINTGRMVTSEGISTDRKRLLDCAIDEVLSNNFDSDTKTCIVTILKILDNVLQQPYNGKVRSIKVSNPIFHTKVIQRRGHHILLACGFVLKHPTTTLDTNNNNYNYSNNNININDMNTQECLVLEEDNEDTNLIVATRTLLTRVAIHQLGCDPKMLPEYKSPKPKVELLSSVSTTTTNNNNNNNNIDTNTPPGFDVYRGQRYDGQSAAVGTHLGPPVGWKSKTDAQLEHLQQQQQSLQVQLQKETILKTPSSASSSNANANANTIDRQWTAFLPPSSSTTPHSSTPTIASSSSSIVRTVASMASDVLASSSSSSSSSVQDNGGGDRQLLASHFQQQHQKRIAEQNRGFTTKAMRDLERVSKTKVYSHTILHIQFPDGCTVRGYFLPTESIDVVMDCIRDQVLVSTTLPTSKEEDSSRTLPAIELYQTPPRQVLSPTATTAAAATTKKKTLYDWGLVPAAKVYVSWKSPLSSNNINNNNSKGWYIKRELFPSDTTLSSADIPITMPISVPVIQGGKLLEQITGDTSNDDNNNKTTSNATSSTNNNNKRKKTKEEKEAALMTRMLGGGGL